MPAWREFFTDKERYQFWWQLTILVLVCTFAVYESVAFDEQMQTFIPESKSNASTFNKKPSGLTGLFDIAERAGLKCHTWLFPYRQLSGIKGVLVIVAPSESLEGFEAQQVLKWVGEGNDLIYLDYFTFKFMRRLLQQIEIQTKDLPDFSEQSVPVVPNRPELDHVSTVTLSADTSLIGGEPIIAYQDKTIFTKVKVGKGHVLIGSAPNICANRRLADKRNWPNFQFLVNCLSTANGDVWFDERSHGYSQSVNVFVFLARGAMGFVFAQLVLILLVAVLSASQRFGLTTRIDDKRSISNLDFINGLANAYRRAKANSAVLEIIGQSFRNKLCKALSVSPRDSTERIIASWNMEKEAQKNSFSEIEDLPGFLREYEAALKQNTVSDSQLRHLISSCDKITGRLEEVLATRNRMAGKQDIHHDQ